MVTSLPQRALAALSVVAVIVITALLGRAPAGKVLTGPAFPDSWVYLSDLPWERTSTEWVMVGNEGLPAVDSAFFTGGPLLIGEHPYSKGLGTHAPSELVYKLDGGYSRLETLVGVEEDGLPGRAGARFLLFADGTKIYESPVRQSTDPPFLVQVPLYQVQELRLVALRSDDSERGARVAWAEARLLQAPVGPEEAAAEFVRWLRNSGQVRALQRAAEERQLDTMAHREVSRLTEALGGRLPGPDDPPVVFVERRPAAVTIVNSRIAVSYDLGGARNGSLDLLDVAEPRYIARGLVSSLQWDGGSLDLSRDARPAEGEVVRVETIDRPDLGSGRQVTISLTTDQEASIGLDLQLFQRGAIAMSRIRAGGLSVAGGQVEVRHFASAPDDGFLLGEQVHYLANLTRLRHVVTQDDGIHHHDRFAWGSPIYLWDEKSDRSLIFALLDETPSAPLFTFERQPGRALGQLSLQSSRAAADPSTGSGNDFDSGWTYLEVGNGGRPQQRFANYRALSAHLYPPPQLPGWFGHQWLSWYVYYMDINEQVLVDQIDAIANNFGDLGPWHIIVDAGWYVAEGREGSDWQHQDLEKFPRGLRWLVDYAHGRGVKVVLYWTAPYLNTREEGWNWLGLRTLVEEHPDWVIPLDKNEPLDDYAYDFQNPDLRAYMTAVMRDYFLRYKVDGIKLDGLGSAGESVLYSAEGAAFSISDQALNQTMDIYRFVYESAQRYKPDAYIESGWVTPVMANPYAHTFRYGDEEPLFTRPYPLPGLIEHVDFAAYQHGMLGQRANMGAIYGDPNESLVNLWWLGAALAMGTQVSLSFDMQVLTPDNISLYRSLLAAYRPFEGDTRIDPQMEQQVFNTRVGDTWYVGALNREQSARRITVDAELLGLAPGSSFVLYEVDTGRLRHVTGSQGITLEPESFELLVARADPGVLWTNSRTDAGEDGSLTIWAPPTVNGVLYLYALEAPTLYLDGLRLEPQEDRFEGDEGYTYDGANGLVTLWFPAGSGSHTLSSPGY